MAKVNLPVRYSQFDPRWANELLGYNTDPKYSIYNYGCLLTSLANVCKYYQKDETPATLNEKLKEPAIAGFEKGGGLYDWGSLPKIYPDIIEKHVVTPDPLTDEQVNEIKQALDQGLPVLVCLDYNPKTVAREDHFSLLVDYDPADENNFTLADTLGGLLRSLRTYLAWFKPSARVTIESYTIYSGPAATSPVENLPVQTNTIIPNPQSALPANYAAIVHGSTEWDQVVAKYGNGKNPDQANFGEVEQEINKQVDGKVSERVATPEKIVVTDGHAALQWAQTVEYLELGKQPNDALFEDAKRVIAGLKSAKTDYDNKRIEAEKQAAQRDILITNKDAEISTLKKQVSRMEKLQKAEIDGLIKSIPSFAKLKVQYEGAIRELQTDLTKALEDAGGLRIQLSDTQVEQGIKQAVDFSKAVASGNQKDILTIVGKTALSLGGSAAGIITTIINKRFKK